MSSTVADLLSAQFVDGEVLQFRGRGDKVFDYIEDETVMDRLDDVLGVGAWSITVEPISLAEGIVKVRLSGQTPEGNSFVYEDFGYQTREGGEALKEAVSDGIRRCGRYLGIGRYLYRKHDSTPRAQVPSSPAPRPVAAAVAPTPRPAAARPTEEPEELAATFTKPANPYAARAVETWRCPVHGEAKVKRNSKGFYCSGKNDDGSWCDEKP